MLKKGGAISAIFFMVILNGGCGYPPPPILYIKIIPVSGGNYGYTISLTSEKEIKCTKNELGLKNNSFVLNKEVEDICLKLSEREQSIVNAYLKNPKKENFQCDDEALGTWNFFLKKGDVNSCINTVHLNHLPKNNTLRQMLKLFLKKAVFIDLNAG